LSFPRRRRNPGRRGLRREGSDGRLWRNSADFPSSDHDRSQGQTRQVRVCCPRLVRVLAPPASTDFHLRDRCEFQRLLRCLGTRKPKLWGARSALAVFPRATGKYSVLAADRSSQDGPRPLSLCPRAVSFLRPGEFAQSVTVSKVDRQQFFEFCQEVLSLDRIITVPL
jgi:hypothetical protein